MLYVLCTLYSFFNKLPKHHSILHYIYHLYLALTDFSLSHSWHLFTLLLYRNTANNQQPTDNRQQSTHVTLFLYYLNRQQISNISCHHIISEYPERLICLYVNCQSFILFPIFLFPIEYFNYIHQIFLYLSFIFLKKL